MTAENLTKIVGQVNLEMIIWPMALIFLAVTNPDMSHWSLCPVKNMGFDHCPGCGLGRSISFIFNGQWVQSFEAHPLGIPAIALLVYRTIYLTSSLVRNYSNKRHQL